MQKEEIAGWSIFSSRTSRSVAGASFTLFSLKFIRRFVVQPSLSPSPCDLSSSNDRLSFGYFFRQQQRPPECFEPNRPSVAQSTVKHPCSTVHGVTEPSVEIFVPLQ